jgi:hypothetical protein
VVKILVTLGAIVAAIAQSFEIAHAVGAVSPYTIAGIAAAVLVALGGFYLAFTEQDASTALETARDAIAQAREYSDEISRFERVQLDVRPRDAACRRRSFEYPCGSPHSLARFLAP